MSIFKGLRFRTMLDAVMASETPEEMHDLFTEFLDGEFEIEGRTKYRSVDLQYYVGYSGESREIIFELTVRDKADTSCDDPVLNVKMRLKRDAMSYLHKDIKAMISMMS